MPYNRIDFDKSQQARDRIIQRSREASTFKEVTIILAKLDCTACISYADREKARDCLLARREEIAKQRGRR